MFPPGIIYIDLRRMNRIIEINEKNMYAVVEPYHVAAGDVWHFDFYRFNDPREWEDAGFRDIFASAGVKLCEWPDKAFGVMPVPDVSLHIDVNSTEQRVVTLKAHTPCGEALLT